jgi:hypothetical protein
VPAGVGGREMDVGASATRGHGAAHLRVER